MVTAILGRLSLASVMAAAHSRAPSAHADQPGCSRRRLFPSTVNSPEKRNRAGLLRGNSMIFIELKFIELTLFIIVGGHFLENFIHPFWIHLVHPPDYSSESVTLTPPSPNADFSTACVTLSIFPRRVKFHELVS